MGCQRVWDAQQIYGVAMSRSFGDCQCHPFIISVPDLEGPRLLDAKDRVLVMATDGVWARARVVRVRVRFWVIGLTLTLTPTLTLPLSLARRVGCDDQR